MRPPLPRRKQQQQQHQHQQQRPALRVTAITLAFRNRVRDVLVHPSLPLDELERCIAAGFELNAFGQSNALPIAVRDDRHQIVYPLSFLTRSPELFEDGTFTLLVTGDNATDDSAGASAHANSSKRAQRNRNRQQRHAGRSRQRATQASKSSSLQLESSDDSDSDSEHELQPSRNGHAHRIASVDSDADGAETADDPDADASSSDNDDNDDDGDDDDELMRELDLTDFELPQLVHVFTQACPTGALDRTTFNRCLEKILSQSGRYDPLARRMFERLFALFDTHARTGVVDVAAFLGGVSVLASGERDEKVRLTFELYDVDSDGFISLAEMVKYLTSVYRVIEVTSPELFESKHVSPQELGAVTARQCFQESQLNADGKLSFDAFRAWYTTPGPTQFVPPSRTRQSTPLPTSSSSNPASASAVSTDALTLERIRDVTGLLAVRADDLLAQFRAAATFGSDRQTPVSALSRAQFRACFDSILAQQQRTPTQAITKFVNRLFDAFDTNKNNSVDFSELAAGLSILCGRGSQDDRVAAAFALFDADSDGFVTPLEMTRYLASVFRVLFTSHPEVASRIGIDATQLADCTTRQAFADVDANRDGRLSFDEFRNWYKAGGAAFTTTQPSPPTTTPTLSTATDAAQHVAIGARALASIDLVASLTRLRDLAPSELFELLAAQVNDDGVLSRAAFHAVFDDLARDATTHSGRALAASDTHKLHAILDTVFDAFDVARDDSVDFCELSSGISVFCNGSQREKIEAAFSLFDVNQDGSIGRDELVTYLTSVFRIVFTMSAGAIGGSNGVSPEQLAHVTAADAFASVDMDKRDGGRMTLDAFTKWYSRQHVLDFDAFQSQTQNPTPNKIPTQTQQAQANGQPQLQPARTNSIAPAAKTTLQEMKTLTNLSAYDVNDIFDFFQASADADGSLSQAAFFRCFNKLLASDNTVDRDLQQRTRTLLSELFTLFDADANGTIDVQELGSGLSILCGGTIDDKARSLFRLYDLNHDGVIAPAEMTAYLTGVFKVLYKASPHLEAQTSMAPHELALATTRECFNAFDRNRDEQLSFDEFRAWLEHQNPLAASSTSTESVQQPTTQSNGSDAAVASTDVIPVDVATRLSGLKDIALDKVTELFTSAADSSGRISRKAFDACFYRYLCSSATTSDKAPPLSRAESNSVHAVIDRLFTAFDTDANGFVDLNELASGLSVLCGGTDRDAKVQAAFDLYDTNGDGLISEDEMAHYLGSVFKLLYALDPTREATLGISADDLAVVTAAEIFADADVNHDGRLTFDEFRKWYALPEQSSFNAIVAPLDLDEVRRLTNLGNLDVVDVFERFAECADDAGLLQRDAFDACFAAIIETASHPRSDAEKLRAKVVADRLFDVFDSDADGQIDFSELASGLSVLCRGARVAKVKAAFRLYDFNGDGYISLDEMTRYLTSIFRVLYEVQPAMQRETGVPPDELGRVTAEQAFLEADANHDGKLSYDEFLTWYTSPSQAGISSVVAKNAVVDSSLRWRPLQEIKQLTNLATLEPDEVFEIFAAEADRDGLLSRTAFNASFRKVMETGNSASAADDVNGSSATRSDATAAKIKDVVDGLFDLFDSDGSGYVDFGELASGLSVLCGGTNDQKLQAAFSLFDFNGDGYISLDEMTRYLTSVFRVLFQVSPDTQRVGVSPEELGHVTAEQAFAEADMDHDGRLTLAEFQQWYQQPGGVGEVAKNGEQLFSLAEARRLTNLDAVSPIPVFEALADCADDRGFVARAAFDDCFRRLIAQQTGRVDAKHYEHVTAILDRLFALFDTDGNGVVDFSELSSGLAVMCGGTSDDKVAAAFALFDYNGDGAISLDEMTRFLTSVFAVLQDASMPLAQVVHESAAVLAARTAAQAFADADVDDDGRLTYDAFRQWYAHSSAAKIERLIETSVPEWLALREVRQLAKVDTLASDHVRRRFAACAGPDGTLTRTQFLAAVVSFTQPSSAESTNRLELLVDRLFALFDTDNNELIDKHELDAGLSTLCDSGGNPANDRVRAAFALYDVNRDGFISLGEMRLYLTSVFRVLFEADPAREQRLGVSADELGAITAEQAFAEADVDRDGRLSFDEFQAWFAQSQSSSQSPTSRDDSVNAARPNAVVMNASDNVPDWVSLELVKEMTQLEKYAPDQVFELFANRCADDGTISREAFEECFEELIDEQFKNDDAHLDRLRLILDRLFTIFDTDGNGIVDFCELSSGLSVLCGGTREDKVRSAFALYDLNQDGFISLEEMAQYLTSVFKVLYETSPGTHAKLGVPPDELAVITAEQCFLEADLNHDGKLSFDEFVRWYSRSPGFDAPVAAAGGVTSRLNDTHKRVTDEATRLRGLSSPSSDRTAENGRSKSPKRTDAPVRTAPVSSTTPSSAGFPSSLLQNIASSSRNDALLSPTAATALTANSANMDEARQLLKLDSYEVNDLFDIFAEAAPSGELSFAAFKKCFDQIIKLAGGHATADERQAADAMVHRLFTVFDTNKSNTVDFGELASGLSVLSGSSMDDKVRAAFQLYDINGDGFITLDEMVSYMTSIFRVMYETSDATKVKMGVSPEELARVTASQCFKEADLNNDSKLSFDEFKKWCTSAV